MEVQMAETTKIQWTEKTWNPWYGCDKVSPGCKFCYMYRENIRDPGKVQRSKTKFDEPLTWNKTQLVFTCSWSDFFHQDADQWRDEVWRIIKRTPHLTYQVLTKRIDRVMAQLPDDWGDGYPNVWLGVSTENEELTYSRVTTLLQIPSKLRFISAEPLIEGVVSDRTKALIKELDWVIIGGESGHDFPPHKYRPMELRWAADLLDFCLTEGVATFMKQLGTYQAKQMKLWDNHGGIPEDWPQEFQVRQMPDYKAVPYTEPQYTLKF